MEKSNSIVTSTTSMKTRCSGKVKLRTTNMIISSDPKIICKPPITHIAMNTCKFKNNFIVISESRIHSSNLISPKYFSRTDREVQPFNAPQFKTIGSLKKESKLEQVRNDLINWIKTCIEIS